MPTIAALISLRIAFLFTWVFMAAMVTYGGVLLAKRDMQLNEQVALRPDVSVDRPVVLAGEAAPFFVLIRIDAADVIREPGDPRPSVNLGLVLDRSGSMADVGKIDYLRKAAAMVVERLSVRDHLAIVEYDDVITVMWPSAPVESLTSINRLCAGLEPRGSTNLVGGMMRGADEVLSRRRTLDDASTIHRVLLLSDGLANQGVTDPREIARLVRSVKSDGVRISALGLGRDYDENLMQAIAENGGGNYYYVEHPSQMARIFERELETLFTTVAKDVTLRFEPSAAVKSVQVLAIDADKELDARNLDLDNFFAGESRTLLLRVETQPATLSVPVEDLELGRLNISYFDVASGRAEAFEQSVKVAVSNDADRVSQARNANVTVEAELIEAERRHSEVIALYESGQTDEADAQMQALELERTSNNEILNDSRLKTKIEALKVERSQMAAAAAAPEERSAYLKSSKQRLYQAQQGKRVLYSLNLGDKGIEVERLQEALSAEGLYGGPVDGVYTADVQAAVEAFQSREALAADGVAGPQTMEALGLY